jgi:ribosomal protein S18 acetylase RimI-like enzyme
VTAGFFSEALSDHDRSAFASGHERIDSYFQHTVFEDVKRSCAACCKLPRYPSVPAVLIGWLGRDLAFRGQQVGEMLLADAITRLVAAPIVVHAICAAAIDKAAADFYRAHQFAPFLSRPRSLSLPMKTALLLVKPKGGSTVPRGAL